MRPDRIHQAVSADGTRIVGGAHGHGPPSGAPAYARR
jgi:hypothetical protein